MSNRCAWTNSCCQGQAEAMANLMRRTLTLTRAPIFSSFSRMVAQVACVRIPIYPPMHSNAKPPTDSDLKPSGVPI